MSNTQEKKQPLESGHPRQYHTFMSCIGNSKRNEDLIDPMFIENFQHFCDNVNFSKKNYRLRWW